LGIFTTSIFCMKSRWSTRNTRGGLQGPNETWWHGPYPGLSPLGPFPHRASPHALDENLRHIFPWIFWDGGRGGTIRPPLEGSNPIVLLLPMLVNHRHHCHQLPSMGRIIFIIIFTIPDISTISISISDVTPS
jgi:hypothetical protein